MKEVDAILSKLIKDHNTPAVHYLIFDQKTVLHRFYSGLADIENQKQIQENTTFHAFSVTKTFTALGVLQLHEKKLLNIDSSIIRYVPDFPYGPDITIRQLLSHSAGIPNPNPLSWIHLHKDHKTFNSKAFFNPIFQKHPKTRSKPNEKFAYSNLGYVFLGQLIETVSGQNYEDYIIEQIIKPLGIEPKDLNFELFDKNTHAKGYQKRFSLLNGILGFFMDKSKFMGPSEGKWKPFKDYYVNDASYGGLVGNPDGFRKYIQELLKEDSKIISDEKKKLLFTENLTNSNKQTGMCLSWFKGTLKGQEYFAHAGGGGGFYCEIRIYPKINKGSVIMFNHTGVTDKRFLDKIDGYLI